MIHANFWTTAVFLAVMCGSVQLLDTRRWKSGVCERKLSSVTSQIVYAPSPPDPTGHWTSYRCENRPGPEFVLRKYHFRRSNFQVKVYYYADSACTKPTHVIAAKGAYRSMRGSWRVRGGHEAKYRVFQISIIPYTSYKALEVEKLLKRHCPTLRGTEIKEHNKYKILQFSKYNRSNPEYSANDFDCSNLFNFTLNELQLIRIEKHQLKQKWNQRVNVLRSLRRGKGQIDTELFLGDLHTNTKHRQSYRPTAYQDPLKLAKTPGCEVCKTISSANEWAPPRLLQRPYNDSPIEGEWISTRCEARSYGQFVTRHVLFFPGGRAWQGEYVFYKDPTCTEPSYAVFAKGDYVTGDDSVTVPHAREYMFRTSKLKVTVKEPSMVNYFNSYAGTGCGKTGVWKLGITQDVTATKGCEILGLTLPNIEYELLKADMRDDREYLYVGQRPSEYVSLSLRRNRPTSFQPPLVKCSSNEIFVKPMFNSYASAQKFPLMETFSSKGEGSCLKPFTVLLAAMISFVLCV